MAEMEAWIEEEELDGDDLLERHMMSRKTKVRVRLEADNSRKT